jgi:phage host-nuclease inhibitor protein Gam
METDADALQLFVPDERFHVLDAESANFVIRKILEARRYGERAEAFAAAEMRRAQREEHFFWARFGGELEAWAKEQIAREFRRKSLSLPSGTLGFRTEPQRLTVQDEARVLAWCRSSLPRAVKTAHSVLKSEITDYIKSSGELPPGVEITGGGERFYVK